MAEDRWGQEAGMEEVTPSETFSSTKAGGTDGLLTRLHLLLQERKEELQIPQE